MKLVYAVDSAIRGSSDTYRGYHGGYVRCQDLQKFMEFRDKHHVPEAGGGYLVISPSQWVSNETPTWDHATAESVMGPASV